MSVATRGLSPNASSAFLAYGRYVNPPLAHFLTLSGRDQRFVRAEGNQLETERGEVYRDWLAGFGSLNLGHNPPVLLACMKEHLTQLAPNLYMESLNPYSGALAERLVRAAGSSFETAYFCNSGTEAVEAALKLSIAATRRRTIVYCAGGYHGTTLGSLSMMAEGPYRAPFAPLLPEFISIPFNDLVALSQALEERPVAAFVVEPIQMESGVRAMNPGFLREAKRLCEARGTLLVLDEVQTGMGRTGELFAFQKEGVAPDVLILAKSLGGGMMPLGAIVAGRGLFQKAYGTYLSSEIHNSTFGGNALACRVGLTTLSLIDDPEFLSRVRERGEYLKRAVEKRVGDHPLVTRLSFHGLLGGLKLKAVDHPWFSWKSFGLNDMGDEPVTAALLIHRLYKRKIIVQICGHDWSTIRIEPPLTITSEDIDSFVTILAEELEWIYAHT